MTPADYTAQIVALFPRGRLWSWAATKLLGLSQAIGDELARVETDALAARDEADTQTISSTLDRWEADLGLPSTGTEAERLARIQSWALTTRRTRPEDYRQRMAAVLGLTAAQVEVLERFDWMQPVIEESREHYRFNVYRDPSLPGTYSVPDAQALLDSYSQSHTLGRVITSKALKCDDPDSVCDSTPLEGRGYWPDGTVWLRETGITDDGAGRIVSHANAGSFGAEFTSSTTARRPYLWTLGGKPCPRWLDDADQQSILTDAGKTAASAMHLAGTDATLSFFLRVEERADTASVLATRASGSGGAVGFKVNLTSADRIFLVVGDGTTDVVSIGAGPQTIGVGDHVIQIRKTGLTYEIFANGAAYASATAAGLSATAAAQIALSAADGSSTGIPGLLPEFILRPYALTDAELVAERAYLARWGTRAPMYSPTVWWRGDDSDAVISGGRYTSIPNRGSWGGNMTPDGGTGPVAGTYAGKPSPFFAAGSAERLRCIRSPVAQFLAMASMHLSGTDGTVCFVVDFGDGTTTESLVATSPTTTGLGMLMNRGASGRLNLYVGNGTTAQLSLAAGPTTITTGRFVVTIRKTGTSYDVRVNGSPYTSGTSAALSTTSAASQALEHTPTADAYLPEFIAWNFRLSDAQAAEMEAYLGRWA